MATDIQDYLETFNKEIQDNTADGHKQLTLIGEKPTIKKDTTEEQEECGFLSVDSCNDVSELDGIGETITANGADDAILSSVDEAYQTLTIVPSDSSTGEISYVLIVQPDGKGDLDFNFERSGLIPNGNAGGEDDQDMTVYDFDDGEEFVAESNDEDDKSRVVKFIPRRSQVASAAHMCNYCNYTTAKRYLLSRHMKSHSEERPHKCSVCERGFKTLASLQNHVNTHTGVKPHKCRFCASQFTTSGELIRHVRYRHTHEKPHRCLECDYSSVELSKLRRHIRCHTGERPYQCPHCTYASPDTFKLKRHLRIHTGEKPYGCDICGSRFTQSNSLKAHKLIHAAPGCKPMYRCELCPASCGRKTDLRIHVQKLHMNAERPLKCKRCGKSFADRYTFRVHNKTHDGEKCFKCDLCPYASTSQRHLESHMLIHTDQKPYQCPQCDQCFRQRQLLKRHINFYHLPNFIPPLPKEKTHRCPECGRDFRHKGNLIRHLAVHDPGAANQEKALALRMGRQKKVQIIDGHHVEMFASDICDDDELMAVEDNDGQQYVVLEVIQIQGEDGNETMAMVTGGGVTKQPLTFTVSGDDSTVLTTDSVMTSIANGVTAEEISPELLATDVTSSIKRARVKSETKKEVETCFGFDEDDDGCIMEDDNFEDHLLSSA